MLQIKSRLNTGFDLVRLCSLTILCALFAIPLALFNPELYADAVAAFFATIVYELFFLVVFVLPPAIGFLALAYFATKQSHEKRMENAGYGYIAGFLVGLMLILVVWGRGSFDLAGIIGIALVGFCIGLALSFVSPKPLGRQ